MRPVGSSPLRSLNLNVKNVEHHCSLSIASHGRGWISQLISLDHWCRFVTASSQKPVTQSNCLLNTASEQSPSTTSAVVCTTKLSTTCPDSVEPSARPSVVCRCAASWLTVPTSEQISKFSSNIWICRRRRKKNRIIKTNVSDVK